MASCDSSCAVLGDINMIDKHEVMINRRNAIIVLYGLMKDVLAGIIRIIIRN